MISKVRNTAIKFTFYITFLLILMLYSYSTAQDSGVSPIEFAWSLTGTPLKIERVIDQRFTFLSIQTKHLLKSCN